MKFKPGIHLPLQFFAEGTPAAESDDTQNTSATGDNTSQQTETAGEKTFTQKELDEIVNNRLARAKKEMPSKEEMEAFRKWQDDQKTAEQRNAEALKAAQDKQTAAEQRAEQAEAYAAAVKAGVSPDAAEDVVALARGKVSDTVTLEAAIKEVLTKYPHFSGKTVPATTGAATLNNNPTESDIALRKAMGLPTTKTNGGN